MSRIPLRAVLLLAAFLPLAAVAGPATPASGQTGNPPNVLIILTDDQRPTETLDHMPKTMQWFGSGGTNFTNAYAPNPVCCPGRATIMTGQFTHNNQVLTNADAALLNQDSTVQRYLDAAGYRTAILGKYLNGWPVAVNPPHFDRWHTMDPGYYGAQFNNNGVVSTEGQYSTDVIADKAEDLIRDDFGASDSEPWFMYLSPYAPHEPSTAEPDYQTSEFGLWPGNPAVFEIDESDKPQYVRKAAHTYEEGIADRTAHLRTLQSVDDLVEQVFQAMADENEGNTLAFFLSDNGFFWGEHGLRGKQQPYTQAMQIPFLMRWPDHVSQGATDGRPVAQIDVLPTILEAAGIAPAPEFPLDGRSLLGANPRLKMLTESWNKGPRGPWASIRTADYQYTEYYENDAVTVEFREYYEVAVDPWQLTNLFNDGNAANDPYHGALHRELMGARGCAGPPGPTSCNTLLEQPGIPRLCPGKQLEPGHHLVGSTGPDRINGISERDVACGRGGNDIIRGKGGNDLLLGQQGRDKLVGSTGHDVLLGKAGRDYCQGGPGKDRFKSCEKRKG